MSDIDRIFLSYHHARENQAWLNLIRDELERALGERATVWSDRDLVAGENWLEAIRREITLSSVGVFLASQGFFESEVIALEELGPLLQKLEDAQPDDEDAVRLLFVPIGDEFAAAYEKSDLKNLHTVLPPDAPLPEDPDSCTEDEKRDAVERVVFEIERALDKTWVDLEKSQERYRIKRRLNRKPHTRTYEATVRGGLEQSVVIKTVSRDHGRWDFYTALDKVRELTDETNVITLLDADFEAGAPYYYVIGHVAGGSLLSYVGEREWLSWDEVQRILCKIGGAVEAVRKKGAMGEFLFDLKPSHVMIKKKEGEQIEPFLSFVGRPSGLRGAHLLEHVEETYQSEEDLTEAAAYLLPEHFMDFGRSVTTDESDVYLLGLLAHNLLTGRLPKELDIDELRAAYQSDDKSEREGFFQIAPLLVDPEKPEWTDDDYFRAVVDKMVALDPDSRFPNCTVAMRALEAPRMYASQQVRKSYERCRKQSDFFHRFYAAFFEACGDARGLFGDFATASPDNEAWTRQKRKVSDAAVHLFTYFERRVDLRSPPEPDRRTNTALDYLANNHKATLDSRAEAKNLAIDGAWFDTFIEVLAKTADLVDPENHRFPDGHPVRAIRLSRWLQVLRPGAHYLRRHQTGS